jgi:hypothetical protein
MDKITPKTSFGQWFSPINLQLFEENDEIGLLYKKINDGIIP